jgi:hypothetical protein
MANTTCVFNTLSKGNAGTEQTKILQRALKIKDDGIYGPVTETTVKSYQKKRGLVIDGIAGQITCTALGIWCTKQSSSTKVCSLATTMIMQPNNYTCGVTVLRMIGSRHGSIPSYKDVMKYTGCNPVDGTGHSGMKNTLINLMKFSSAKSYYRSELSLDDVRQKIREGYDVAINLKTGGLSGWGGDWPHWELVQCIDDDYVWFNDPDRGPMIRHDRSTVESCMDHNSNPDFIIAKK